MRCNSKRDWISIIGDKHLPKQTQNEVRKVNKSKKKHNFATEIDKCLSGSNHRVNNYLFNFKIIFIEIHHDD